MQNLERDCTYLRSQCRLKVRSQKLQISSWASYVVLSELLRSGLVGSSVGDEAGGWLLSGLSPGVAGVFENDCSSITDEPSLSEWSKAGSSSSEVELMVRYGACITGLISSSKANGQKTEVETLRESPNLDDEVQLNEEVIKRR